MTGNEFYGIYAPELVRLAYSWETSGRNDDGAKLSAQAIKNAR